MSFMCVAITRIYAYIAADVAEEKSDATTQVGQVDRLGIYRRPTNGLTALPGILRFLGRVGAASFIRFERIPFCRTQQ